MGPIWGRQDPGGPHVGPLDLAVWIYLWGYPAYINTLWPSDAYYIQIYIVIQGNINVRYVDLNRAELPENISYYYFHWKHWLQWCNSNTKILLIVDHSLIVLWVNEEIIIYITIYQWFLPAAVFRQKRPSDNDPSWFNVDFLGVSPGRWIPPHVQIEMHLNKFNINRSHIVVDITPMTII